MEISWAKIIVLKQHYRVAGQPLQLIMSYTIEEYRIRTQIDIYEKNHISSPSLTDKKDGDFIAKMESITESGEIIDRKIIPFFNIESILKFYGI